MEIIIHTGKNCKIAELKKNSFQINDFQDALDLMTNANYQDSTNQIIFAEDLNPDFFELRTGFAGEILQKYSNYKNRVAIIGDFSNIQSKSLRDFIYECNKGNQIFFVKTKEETLERLAK